MPPCAVPDGFPWGCDDNIAVWLERGMVDECWLCMTDRDDFGDGDLRGVGIGCYPCQDLPVLLSPQPGALNEGQFLDPPNFTSPRFLVPEPFSPGGGNRNARGVLEYLRAGRAQPVPLQGTTYLRAPCYGNHSPLECFTQDGVCSCFPWPSWVCTGEPSCRCAAGEAPGDNNTGELVVGFAPDCFSHSDATFSGAKNTQFVRAVNDDAPHRVTMGAVPPLYFPQFHRSGSRRHSACNVNVLSHCTDFVQEGALCRQAFANDCDLNPGPGCIPPVHYCQDSAVRGIFDEVDITVRAEFAPAIESFDYQQAQYLEAKSIVFEQAFDGRTFPDFFSGLGFKRLDRLDRLSTDSYARGWIFAEAPSDALPECDRLLNDEWPELEIVGAVSAAVTPGGTRLRVRQFLTEVDVFARIAVHQGYDGRIDDCPECSSGTLQLDSIHRNYWPVCAVRVAVSVVTLLETEDAGNAFTEEYDWKDIADPRRTRNFAIDNPNLCNGRNTHPSPNEGTQIHPLPRVLATDTLAEVPLTWLGPDGVTPIQPFSYIWWLGTMGREFAGSESIDINSPGQMGCGQSIAGFPVWSTSPNIEERCQYVGHAFHDVQVRGVNTIVDGGSGEQLYGGHVALSFRRRANSGGLCP